RDLRGQRIRATDREVAAALLGQERRHRRLWRRLRRARKTEADRGLVGEGMLTTDAERRGVVVILDQYAADRGVRYARWAIEAHRQLLELLPPGPLVVEFDVPVVEILVDEADLGLIRVRDLGPAL